MFCLKWSFKQAYCLSCYRIKCTCLTLVWSFWCIIRRKCALSFAFVGFLNRLWLCVVYMFLFWPFMKFTPANHIHHPVWLQKRWLADNLNVYVLLLPNHASHYLVHRTWRLSLLHKGLWKGFWCGRRKAVVKNWKAMSRPHHCKPTLCHGERY